MELLKELWMKYRRLASPVLFAFVLICFAMPFIGVQCGEMTLSKYSAYDVMAGSDDNEQCVGDFQIILYVALASTIIACLSALVLKRGARLLSVITGCIAFSMIVLFRIWMSKVISDMDFEYEGVVSVKYLVGYWLSLIAALSAVVLKVMELSNRR
ncbi:MAG: hypothetical protein DRH44_03610 [Candidatus Coatesbacteria bacterium]|nr:MAG: hypothetical protein DRH44_03610 [Candidatus Coatesbacteria bacterium]